VPHKSGKYTLAVNVDGSAISGAVIALYRMMV
jgi:hypothetical protein